MDQVSLLLVDDDADEHLFFSEAIKLIDKNLKLISCISHTEFWNCIKENVPSLMFIDINMPAVTGFELLQALKTDKRYKNTRLIIYSTSTNPDDIKRSYDLGADLYFHKTVSVVILSKKLALIISYIKNGLLLPKNMFKDHTYVFGK